MIEPEWIAADWGTTNLRLWAMRGAEVLDRRQSDRGMGALTPDQFAPALAAATEGWGDATVIACGMVGARQGWIEAPYAPVPVAATPAMVRVPGRRVWIACGVSQAEPADVMRGEETQIAGLLAARPDFDGVACLPGTHTKWVRVSAGEICHFQTVMTGEVFALLSQQSVLRHSIGDPDDDAGFDAALSDALAQPHRAFGGLFRLRAESLLTDLAPGSAGARLSGALLGLELAAAKPYWLGQEVVIVGTSRLAALYARALRAQGVPVTEAAAEAVTLAGLHRLWTNSGGKP